MVRSPCHLLSALGCILYFVNLMLVFVWTRTKLVTLVFTARHNLEICGERRSGLMYTLLSSGKLQRRQQISSSLY